MKVIEALICTVTEASGANLGYKISTDAFTFWVKTIPQWIILAKVIFQYTKSICMKNDGKKE